MVEVAEGRVTRLAAGGSRACRPALVNEWEIKRLLTGLARTHQRDASANIWMHVDTLGAVTDQRINRGAGTVLLDAALLRVATRARFHPAQLDRCPVEVWVAMDFSLEIACPPMPDTARWRLPEDDPCRDLHEARPPR
jgi:TonB family protein